MALEMSSHSRSVHKPALFIHLVYLGRPEVSVKHSNTTEIQVKMFQE